MEIVNQKRLASHIFRLLKVTEIVFPIGRTNKGNLGLKFTSNNDDFEIMLDAVPLSTKDTLNDDNNIELKRMLEKYWFGLPLPYLPDNNPVAPHLRVLPISEIKSSTPKKGRSKGSKNKK